MTDLTSPANPTATDAERAPLSMVPFAFAYWGFFAYLGSTGPWLTTYHKSLGFDQATAGRLMALFTASAIVGGWTSARFADARRARRQLQRALSLIAGVACVGWLFVDDAWTAAAVIMIQGLCVGPQISMLDAATVDGLRGERRRYGAVRVWGSISWGVGTLIIGATLHADPGALWIIPVSLSGWLLAFHLTTWRLPDTQAQALHDRPKLDLRAAFRSPAMLALLGTSALHGIAFGNYEYFSAQTFRGFGMTTLEIALLLNIGIVFESIVFRIAPRLLARWSPLTLAVTALLATTLRWAAMPLIDTRAGFAVLQPTHAFTFALWYSAALHLIARLVHAEVRTTGQTLLFMSLSCGMTIGVAAGGALRDATDDALTFFVAAGVELCAALLLLLAAPAFKDARRIGAAASD